ncbi:MAG: RNA methyltransferase [Bacteroidia bacterium]
MLSKNQIKFLNSLKQKKGREDEQLFIVEGVKMVAELLNSKINVTQLYATSTYLEREKIRGTLEIIEIKESELERISALSTPNEVLVLCKIPKLIFDINQLKDKLTLVLDNIKDPGNLGTIIRIADWFGIENIVCSKETVDVYNPKVVQATMGSIARVNVNYIALNDLLNANKIKLNYSVFGTLLNGENIYSKPLPNKGFIIVGNESKGISNTLFPFITDKVRIPSFSQFNSNGGEAESLNAAIATAIICSEFRRR